MCRRKPPKLYLLTLFWLYICLLSGYSHGDVIKVAVASNFQPTLSLLIPLFEAQSRHRVRSSSAASGVLYQQILHGADFDVLLSADSLRPQLLEEAGKIIAGSRRSYAIGELVLAASAPQHLPAGDSAAALASYLSAAPARSIAVAATAIAPYGDATKQVYDHFGLWQAAAASRVTANNISQVANLIATGNVNAGFIAAALLTEGDRQWYSISLPAGSYQPIEQQLAILAGTRNIAAARAFTTFLNGTDAQRVITQRGYRLP